MEIRTADWKSEKHVPVIHIPDEIRSGEPFAVTVAVGEEIPHPNTPEHHIAWIELYFVPKNSKIPCFLGRAEFGAHGETGLVTAPRAMFQVSVPGPGTLVAVALCNIHGLWEGKKEIEAGSE